MLSNLLNVSLDVLIKKGGINVWMFIGLLSFLAIFVFLIMAVIAFFKKNGKVKRWLFTALGCFVLLFAAIIADSSKKNDAVPTAKQTDEAKQKEIDQTNAKNKQDEEVANKKTEDEAAAKKKAEEAAQTPQQKIQTAVTGAIGEKSNRDGNKLTSLTIDGSGNIIIKFKIDDAFTENMIAIGAEDDITKALKSIKNSNVDYKTVTVFGTFAMQDKFGNSSEETVINIGFNKETVDKINFDNFDYKNIYSIADTKVFIHPQFVSK